METQLAWMWSVLVASPYMSHFADEPDSDDPFDEMMGRAVQLYKSLPPDGYDSDVGPDAVAYAETEQEICDIVQHINERL